MTEDNDMARKPKKPASKTGTMNFPTLSKPQVSDVIGQRLKLYYSELASQPVPDRFLELLDQLDAKSRPKKTDD